MQPRRDARRLPAAKPVTLALIGMLVAFWLSYLDTPFSRVRGFADWIGNRNGLIVGNYLREGLRGTRGAQILNLERAETAEDRVIYHGHPPTLALLTAGIARLVGGNAPWSQRLLPLASSLMTLLLLHRLVRRTGRDPWPAVLLAAAFPLLGVHGLNFSYEPLCLPAMLLVLLLFQAGWRYGLLPIVYFAGWLDWPVLYLAPFLACADLRANGGRRKRTLGFAAALGVVALASFLTVAAHQVVTMGGIEGGHGLPWHAKILQTLAPPGLPPVGEWLQAQGEYLVESFTLPGVALAVAGFVVFARHLDLATWAFVFAGALHVLAFRGHAYVHDFWLWYWLPCFALAAAAVLRALPPGWAWVSLVLCVGFGGYRTAEVWTARARPPVRTVAADLAELFPPRTVLHQLRGPPGWAVEVFRRAPVLEGFDLLRDLVDKRTFQGYLDGLAAFGYLSRPQRMVLFGPGQKAGDAEIVASFFPNAADGSVTGRAGRYAVYDIERFLFDPATSPKILALLGPDECQRLAQRARMHLVLPRFPAGTRLLWLDGFEGASQRLRGREVRSGGPEHLGAPPPGWTLATWPGGPFAADLAMFAADRLGFQEVQWRGRTWRVPFVAPAAGS